MRKEVPVTLYCFDVLYVRWTPDESAIIEMDQPLIDRRVCSAVLNRTCK